MQLQTNILLAHSDRSAGFHMIACTPKALCECGLVEIDNAKKYNKFKNITILAYLLLNNKNCNIQSVLCEARSARSLEFYHLLLLHNYDDETWFQGQFTFDRL